MRARAPASSANLGPGFDALAVAVGLHVEVEVAPAPTLTVTSRGEGADLPCDRDHLAARVAIEVAGTDRLAVSVRSEIPVGRGLGSSAALAVAAAAAAGADDPLAWGVRIDGHPENAAASVTGGLVAASRIGGETVVRSLPLDDQLRFVLLVPDRPLPTAGARAALPPTVSHADAAFNLGRLALLVAGLADHRQLVQGVMDDRLHQDRRAALFPEAPALLQGLREAGALACCWSGAGPSLLGLATAATVEEVAAEGAAVLKRNEVAGRVLALAADRAGLTVSA